MHKSKNTLVNIDDSALSDITHNVTEINHPFLNKRNSQLFTKQESNMMENQKFEKIYSQGQDGFNNNYSNAMKLGQSQPFNVTSSILSSKADQVEEYQPKFENKVMRFQQLDSSRKTSNRSIMNKTMQ